MAVEDWALGGTRETQIQAKNSKGRAAEMNNRFIFM